MSTNPMHSWQSGLHLMQAALRCGAYARRTGEACRAPAMANGRCRMHGGSATGRPPTNGRYSQATKRRRREIRELLALLHSWRE
jgi:hypothetical protein